MNLHDKLIDVRVEKNQLILITANDRDSENLYYFFRDCADDQENIKGLEILLEQTDTNSFKIMIKDLNHGDLEPSHFFDGKIVFLDQSAERYNQLFFFSSIRVNDEVAKFLSDETNLSTVKLVVFASKLEDYEIEVPSADLHLQEPIQLRAISVKNLEI